MWIESLNTVMDDNKILTLASNERIALTPEMRLNTEKDKARSRSRGSFLNCPSPEWNTTMPSASSRNEEAPSSGATTSTQKTRTCSHRTSLNSTSCLAGQWTLNRSTFTMLKVKTEALASN